MPSESPSVYVLPARFTGWVTVTFEVAGAPALPFEGDAQLVRVPSSGKVSTSSPLSTGTRRFWAEGSDWQRTALDEPTESTPEQVHERPVVLGYNAEGTAARFYVGVGPAGAPPEASTPPS